MAIDIVRSSFAGSRRDGDFAWMIDRPEHSRTLFVFNDNEHQFYDHQAQLGTAHRCLAGGGNAAIRPYQCLTPPRATGIPTGRNGGYRSLDEGRQAIDDAVAHLDALLATGGHYARMWAMQAGGFLPEDEVPAAEEPSNAAA